MITEIITECKTHPALSW